LDEIVPISVYNVRGRVPDVGSWCALENDVADSPAFVWLCEQLQEQTRLDRIEVRGTVRIALKLGGFDPERVRAAQMRVVIERVLPRELVARGVDDAEALCRRLGASLPMEDDARPRESAPDVFGRLSGAPRTIPGDE